MRLWKSLFYVWKDFLKQMNQKNISAFAASTAFFIFISLIPLFAILCAILPYTPITEGMLLETLAKVGPEAVDSLLAQIITDIYRNSGGVITVSVIITLWSAGKGMLAMIRGLNGINDVEENRNYILLRAIACVYTVIMLLAVVVMLILLMFGSTFLSALKARLPDLAIKVAEIISFRFLFSLLLFTVVFAIIYTFVPNCRMNFRKQLPGAMFSAVVWTITSWGFSVYINRFNGFSTYGSLTTVIVVLVYLYMMMYIMLIGAHINRYFGPIYKFLFRRRLTK